VGVETRRQLGGDHWIVGREQARPEISAADPPAGIDPRAEHVTEMIGVDGLANPGHGSQRGEAGVVAAPRDFGSLGHQSSIDTGKRNHVAHRAERHQIEPLQ
jgi:hypothetical protein